MTISLKHAHQSAIADDGSDVGSNAWNAEHGITMATAKVLGRTTAGTGAVEELPLTVAGTASISGTNTGDQTISDATISTTDITTNDVSTAKHGFAPKAPNDAAKYLDGTGAYSVPAGGAGGVVKLESHAASGSANIDFTTFDDTTYGSYEIRFADVTTGGSGNEEALALLVGTGVGPTYHNTVNDYIWGMNYGGFENGPYAFSDYPNNGAGFASAQTDKIPITDWKTSPNGWSIHDTGAAANGTIKFGAVSNATSIRLFRIQSEWESSGTPIGSFIHVGSYANGSGTSTPSPAAITGVRIIPKDAGDTIASGIFTLYGYKK